MKKYVNMADINSGSAPSDARIIELIELLFFAYRDFVSDPDEMLAELGFGRAHHRVLHFVGREGGMTVAQLLDILRITKQSLSRVLKELVSKGYIFQLEGEEDRRQRLLHLSPKGADLHQRLMAPQKARVRRALEETAEIDAASLQAILLNLASPANRKEISEWLQRAESASAAGQDDD
jgi:DNA-binding MarR family transcriptional regulator